VSKHWKPEGESRPRRSAGPWPEGATVGLLLVAAACAGLVSVLYHVAGPRDVFERESDR
jgi:hypothetical protein